MSDIRRTAALLLFLVRCCRTVKKSSGSGDTVPRRSRSRDGRGTPYPLSGDHALRPRGVDNTRAKTQAHPLSTVPHPPLGRDAPMCVPSLPVAHLLDSPHERSPFPTIPPYPRHSLARPEFGALPGTFPYPSPALCTADPWFLSAPVPGASRTPKFATSCTPVGNEADRILEASDSSLPQERRSLSGWLCPPVVG
jgi:hypothetical protein